MKRLLILVSFGVLVMAVVVWAQKTDQPKSGNAEQELIKLEKDWSEATVKGDLAFLDKILAAELTDTDSEGTVWTKAQDLANLKSGDMKVTSAVADDIKVRVYGNVAVTTGRNINKISFKGKDQSGQYRWTDTWVKRAGRWQCVASHGSKILQK
jgi:ketosteroid isomerase-like protein